MAYNKQTWRNNELPVIGQTPINADRLNHMEQGILDAHTGNLTTQERNKLAGVEAGATVNSSDADLRNRATHTGIQPMSSVDGLEGALSSKANAADVMTASERTKLTGIEAGATKNVPATDADVAAGTDEVSYITPKQLKTSAAVTAELESGASKRQAVLNVAAAVPGVTTLTALHDPQVTLIAWCHIGFSSGAPQCWQPTPILTSSSAAR